MKEARTIFKEVPGGGGERSQQYLNASIQLGGALAYMDESAQAKAMHETCLATTREFYGEDHREYAMCLSAVAVMMPSYLANGDPCAPLPPRPCVIRL